MEIIQSTKLFDLLEAYPELEEEIVTIAPPFKNLKNPILRRTVGQLATISQVAKIGNMHEVELINLLRASVGQPLISADQKLIDFMPSIVQSVPDWVDGEPEMIINGTELLDAGERPIEHIDNALKELSSGEYILLLTNFEPIPILEAMEKRKRQTYHKIDPENPDQHFTFIK